MNKTAVSGSALTKNEFLALRRRNPKYLEADDDAAYNRYRRNQIKLRILGALGGGIGGGGYGLLASDSPILAGGATTTGLVAALSAASVKNPTLSQIAKNSLIAGLGGGASSISAQLINNAVSRSKNPGLAGAGLGSSTGALLGLILADQAARKEHRKLRKQLGKA